MPPYKRQRRIDCGGRNCWEDGCTTCDAQEDPPYVGGLYHDPGPSQQTAPLAAWQEARSGAQGPSGVHAPSWPANPDDIVNRHAPRLAPLAYPPAPPAYPPAPMHSSPVSMPPPPRPGPTTPDAALDQEFSHILAGFDVHTLRRMLLLVVRNNPLLATVLRQEYMRQQSSPVAPPPPQQQQQQQAAPEQHRQPVRPAIPLSQMQPVINFDDYSKEAWHALNDRELLAMGGSRQYDESGEVWNQIYDCIKSIDQRTQADSPLATKLSALETLRKIAKTVILGEDTIGHEVRKELQDDSSIPEVMIRILTSMTPWERIRAGQNADHKGSLIDKVEWVSSEARGLCLEGLDTLHSVLFMMKTGLINPIKYPGSSVAPIDLT